jgi:hypothetical protein
MNNLANQMCKLCAYPVSPNRRTQSVYSAVAFTAEKRTARRSALFSQMCFTCRSPKTTFNRVFLRFL